MKIWNKKGFQKNITYNVNQLEDFHYGDVNNDGLIDIISASKFLNTVGWYRNLGGNKYSQQFPILAEYEEVTIAQFVDIDNDEDLDLIVVSGGYELPYKEKFFVDRLYLNEGNSFKRSNDFPAIISSGGCIRPFDFDLDGDVDLFIGGRMKPAQYPAPGKSYLLRNDLENGALSFTDVTAEVMPEVEKIGMVTDAIWTDYNSDQSVDLLVVGEWMPISVFINNDTKFSNQTTSLQLDDTRGWWFTIEEGDLDGDGDNDYVVGNLGKNYKYQATKSETFDLYVKDFDQNATKDIVLSYFNEGTQYPVRGRQCSSDQIPGLQTKFKNYESFATATLEDIYGKSQIENADHYEIQNFANIIMLNQGDGKYDIQELPNESQLSAITDVCILDINKDGNNDIITAGNLNMSEVETPRNDAGIGSTLLGDGHGNFTYQGYKDTGLLLNNDIRKLCLAAGKNSKILLSASNNGPMSAFVINNSD